MFFICFDDIMDVSEHGGIGPQKKLLYLGNVATFCLSQLIKLAGHCVEVKQGAVCVQETTTGRPVVSKNGGSWDCCCAFFLAIWAETKIDLIQALLPVLVFSFLLKKNKLILVVSCTWILCCQRP